MGYRDGSGATLTIGKKLGEGGEGAVYVTREQPDLVAKVYARPVPPEQVAKLDAMVRAGDPALRTVAAWPSALLFDGARPVGFTMRKIAARHPLHDLLGPARRRILFPNTHWTFLIHTATNLARAFEVMHDRGIVIGDVNSNNVVVHRDSTAQLIDCDSFQIRAGETVFRCNVGVPEYQPPELQGCDLSRVERTAEHDLFGLAVMIFQLLFVGKHPFAGVLPPGTGENGAIGANVAARRFFYGGDARRRGLRPPPGSLALSAVTPEIEAHFARAFLGAPCDRPSAAAWRAALAALERATVRCDANPLHRHVDATRCPWCTLERRGLHYFTPPVVRRRLRRADESFWKTISNADVERAWTTIAAVVPPPLRDPAFAAARYPAVPLHLWSRTRRWAYAGGAAAAVLSIAAMFVFLHAWFALAPGVAALYLWAGLAFRPDARRLVTVRERRSSAARQAAAAARDAWRRAALNAEFTERRAALARLHGRLLAQRARFEAERAQLRAATELAALDAFLRRHRIAGLQDPALDAEMRLLLDVRGIVTAADVTWETLPAPRLWGRINAMRDALVAWRQRLERQFLAQRRTCGDPKTIDDLVRRHARERIDGYDALRAGAAELQAIAKRIVAQRDALEARARALADEAARADPDAHVSPLFYKTPVL
ncbi:hypothetical protein WPS_03350 [Vulcanimicrobium alpinum]|uniref:Protein kinase domain-containing protein n=1 Tax=Vulcanimicrobium alpinum TaxID=3016050 RepID=A0AAN1XST7_UNVUL|nr:hypothetical protein [Vulcanimicrobium alpinum]BDE05059.1 hypothetical protein WPS_03350 [Vulcanimicrobium alpinum]